MKLQHRNRAISFTALLIVCIYVAAYLNSKVPPSTWWEIPTFLIVGVTALGSFFVAALSWAAYFE